MPAATGTAPTGAEQVRRGVEEFFRSCQRPAVIEPGEPAIELAGGGCTLTVEGAAVLLEAWDATRFTRRRLRAITGRKPGRLALEIERFGGASGELVLADLARPGGELARRHGVRLEFRERFRRSLARQFAGWKIAELTSGQDLEHSLSPVYPRAFLKQGQHAWAAIGAVPGSAGGAIAFGLIWLDYLRRREHRLSVDGLALLLPRGEEVATCLRLRCLSASAARFAVFVYDDAHSEERVDPADHGNLDTRLEPCRQPVAPLEWVQPLLSPAGADMVAGCDGSLSFRVHGLEFARQSGGKLLFGIDQRQPAGPHHRREIESLTRDMARLRSPDAHDRANPLWRRSAEAWLESEVRRHLEAVDATLLPDPVYGQAPVVAGSDRGVLDLLAVDRSGRLAVIEIKASEDLHLPIQALDYWMRVRWHAGRDEFRSLGYFPGIALKPEPPRLLLVAPALEFHPTTENLLGFFDHAIEVERIGVGVEWRKDLKVVLRIRGARRPA